METVQPQATVDAAQLATIQKKLVLDNKFRNGVNWFYWIAGLSLLNSIIYIAGASFTFVIGLAVTQAVDGVMTGVAKSIGDGGSVARIIGFVINLVIAGVFILFGFLGRKKYRWAIIVGMIFYAVDAVIMLLFQDFLGTAFHAWALFGLWGGLKAMKDLAILEKAAPGESIESLRQRIPTTQLSFTPTSPEQSRNRWIILAFIVGIPVVLGLLFVLIVSLTQ